MKIGDIKSKVEFAYLPTKVEGKTIWLKNYWQYYVCQNVPVKIIMTYKEVSKGKSEYVSEMIYELQWVEMDKRNLL